MRSFGYLLMMRFVLSLHDVLLCIQGLGLRRRWSLKADVVRWMTWNHFAVWTGLWSVAVNSLRTQRLTCVVWPSLERRRLARQRWLDNCSRLNTLPTGTATKVRRTHRYTHSSWTGTREAGWEEHSFIHSFDFTEQRQLPIKRLWNMHVLKVFQGTEKLWTWFRTDGSFVCNVSTCSESEK